MMADWRRRRDGKFEENNGVIKGKGGDSSCNIPRGRMMKSQTHHQDNNAVVVQQSSSSAPVKIPDWSKIYGESAAKFCVHDHHCGSRSSTGNVNVVDDDDDDDDGMVPPHEWVAKKLARTQISSFSVCEGVGRTLKGRDLSRVRTDVLTKTGFLE